MTGPAPKENRRRRNVPVRGEWTASEGVGWQHGDIPEPPDGLLEQSRTAWSTWFGAWFATHWQPGDVPALRILIGLFDEVVRGEFQRATELRLWADTYGITPKGQQDRRWRPANAESLPAPRESDPYSHLRVIPGEPER